LDLDYAIIDFRHFQLEKLGEEIGMGAREQDLRALGDGAHVRDIGAYCVALAVAFLADLLLERNDAFGLAQVDENVTAVHLLDGARNQGADAVLVVLEYLVPLGIAHLLQQDLLGGLDGRAAEVLDGDFHFQVIAGGGFGVVFFGFAYEHEFLVESGHFFRGQGRVHVRIIVHDVDAQVNVDFPRLLVDFSLDVFRQVQVLLGCIDQALLEGGDDHLRPKIFRLGYQVQAFKNFRCHVLLLSKSDVHFGLQNEVQGDGAGFAVRVQGYGRLSDVLQLSDQNPFALHRLPGGNAHEAPQVPAVVLEGLEGPIQSRRGNLQDVILVRHHIVGIHERAQFPAHLGAIADAYAVPFAHVNA